MNKGDLISNIADEAGISKSQATKAVDSFVNNTINTVKKGDKVTLVGFGTFSSTQRAARKGRNPQTGKEINIPARTVAKFKPGKEFANKVK